MSPSRMSGEGHNTANVRAITKIKTLTRRLIAAVPRVKANVRQIEPSVCVCALVRGKGVAIGCHQWTAGRRRPQKGLHK